MKEETMPEVDITKGCNNHTCESRDECGRYGGEIVEFFGWKYCEYCPWKMMEVGEWES